MSTEDTMREAYDRMRELYVRDVHRLKMRVIEAAIVAGVVGLAIGSAVVSLTRPRARTLPPRTP